MLSEQLRSYVKGLQDEIKDAPMSCKMVEPENLHICLSFLGEIEDDKIKNISNVLDGIGGSSFEIEINGIKLIPSENYFRIIVLNIVDKDNKLNFLQKEILEKIGGDSKPAHLTLCRVKNVVDKQIAIKKIKEIETESKNFVVNKIQLLKSELGVGGPTYSILHERDFGS